MVVDMWRAGLEIRTLDQFLYNGAIKQIARVSENAAQSADFEFVADGATLPDEGPIIDLDDREFEFNGMPSDVSYGGKTNLDWLFNEVAQFFSVLVGTIFNIIKAGS